MYYINTFFIYSIIGFIFECIMSIINKTKIGSGILYGPWTPVYGLGGILIILISNYLFKILKVKKYLEVIIVLLVIMVILTFIEWLAGILIEKFFHVTFWDYRKFKFNIGKYISLEVSLFWTVAAIIVIYIVQPLLDKFIYLIPNYVTYILILLMLLDYSTIIIKRKPHK